MRRLRRIVLVVILVPVVLAGGAYLWLRNSLPQTSGTLVLVGPSAEIRITRDAAGVPHIAAANDRDASFALGFVHAQDRLFQMDMMRRLGAGRLAEVLGEGADQQRPERRHAREGHRVEPHHAAAQGLRRDEL